MRPAVLVLAIAAPLAACASEPAEPPSPAPRAMTVAWRLVLDNQPASCAALGLTDVGIAFQGGTPQAVPCDAGAFSMMPDDTAAPYDVALTGDVPDGPHLSGAGALAPGGTLDFPFQLADLGIDWTIAAPDGTYDTLEISDPDFSETLPYRAAGTLHAFALASTAQHVVITLSSSQTGARYTTDRWVKVPAGGTAVSLEIAPTP